MLPRRVSEEFGSMYRVGGVATARNVPGVVSVGTRKAGDWTGAIALGLGVDELSR